MTLCGIPFKQLEIYRHSFFPEKSSACPECRQVATEADPGPSVQERLCNKAKTAGRGRLCDELMGKLSTGAAVVLWINGHAKDLVNDYVDMDGVVEGREESARPVPPEFFGVAHLYGGEVFADEVAGELGIALLEPSVSWLSRLPHHFSKRKIRFMSMADARLVDEPSFVKPARGKSFLAAVYDSGSSLSDAVPADTPVLVSEPVAFASEYRLHILDGDIRASSRYSTHGRIDPAPLVSLPESEEVCGFVDELLGAVAASLPTAVVVDVGIVSESGASDRLAVVEANEAWFSACYAAEPDRVLDVVLRAAQPTSDLKEIDRSFVRGDAEEMFSPMV